MLLYITRKFPPSIGGMQRFNEKLVAHLRKITELELICWGGNQNVLPFLLVGFFFKALYICWTRPIKCIYVSDGLLSGLGYPLKIITRKPVIANIHGRDIAWNLKLYQAVISWTLPRTDKVICVSEALKKECLKRNVPERILYVIPNGVDIDDFNVAPTEKQCREIEEITGVAIENRKILLTVGRIVPKKGIDHFIKNILPLVLKKYPDVLYLIVGNGTLRDEIRQHAEDHNLQNNVGFLGYLKMDSPLLPALYQLAQIFIMPNVPVADDMEGFGIVSLEAGAAGKPVVASKIDGIEEAVKEGKNGFLVPYDNYNLFAQKIMELLENDSDCVEFGRNAKAFVEQKYSWQNISKKYLKVFEEMMA